jgi:hypothetical protein
MHFLSLPAESLPKKSCREALSKGGKQAGRSAYPQNKLSGGLQKPSLLLESAVKLNF